jgi:hypothetical protein
MLAVAGCGPMVAGGGAAEDAGSDEGAAASTDADSDSRGDDPFVTSVTMTAGSDEDDTSDVEPSPGECGVPGTCAGDCAEWRATYEGPAGRADQLATVAVAPDGTIVAAGMRDWVQDVGAGDTVVVAYDPAGEQLWESTPLGSDDGVQDVALSVAVAPNGAIAVGGGSWTTSGDTSGWFALLESDGTLTRVVDLGEEVDVMTTMWTSDGTLVLGGSRVNHDGLRAGIVHRYEASGIVLAQWEHLGIGLPEGVVLGAVATSPTTLAVTGSSDPNNDVWLASLDFQDGVQWVVELDGDGGTSQWADDIAVLPGGDLLLVGAEHDADYNGLSWVGRFGPDGSERWHRTYPGSGCCANALSDVEVSHDGRVFVLGVRGGNGLLMKVQELDCDGEIVWEWNNEDAEWNGSAFSGGLAWSPDVGLVASAGIYPSSSNDQHGFLARFPM